jgi:hypothetical protein
MATTKQAMIASEHLQGMEGTIFNMDYQGSWKDFDQYYERARAMKNIVIKVFRHGLSRYPKQ